MPNVDRDTLVDWARLLEEVARRLANIRPIGNLALGFAQETCEGIARHIRAEAGQ